MEDDLQVSDTEKSPVVIEQYVHDVIGFSSQYGSDIRISYTAYNITGKPSKYPNYGDFPQAFVMRTYGRWWNLAPSRLVPYMRQSVRRITSQDYIDLEFEQAVYPVEVKVYETYNPGSLVRIWAADSNEAWTLLWEGLPQRVGPVARIFSPRIRSISFPTRVLRLEFHHLHLDYYTELDAVLLVGMKELSSSFNKSNSTSEINGKQVSRLLSQIKELNIHNIPNQTNIPNNITQFLSEDYRRIVYRTTRTRPLPEPPKDSPAPVSDVTIEALPDETVLKILGYLDLKSLRKCSLVNKHFYALATDSLLYTELNLKEYWYCVTRQTLNNLALRCQHLQKLDLSWCGGTKTIKSADFVQFISNCGSQLTHIRLHSCKFIDDEALSKIAFTCTRLKELGLRNCTSVLDSGFRKVPNLKHLEYLDLYRTLIELEPLQNILKALKYLKHLNIGSCVHVEDMDKIAAILGEYNKDLISVDFWKATSLTSVGMKALSQCHKLEEVDFGWCLGFGTPGDSLHALAKGCPRLKKLFLAALRGVSDRDLDLFIENCPKMEQVDLMGVRCISREICLKFLTECRRLRLLDLSFCDQIQDTQVALWRHIFPNVSIKRSSQNSGYISPTY
ncbi:F-box/LRR-repeat protein 4 isoform X1 [Schistocerca gregaria]|uniref:F-box/LRR-repeat protein 4 isoform X1 n=1 Tax=Schistocerca gregaria TaxID=7010 RepID=UPI00211E5FD8|nr:F-box/LRR-repeat protein 4 isoform X1 [Schistocerca gregaria]